MYESDHLNGGCFISQPANVIVAECYAGLTPLVQAVVAVIEEEKIIQKQSFDPSHMCAQDLHL